MADRSIEVKFPDHIRVKSPEIEAISSSVEHISKWIQKDFKEVVRPLKVLESLPEILADLKKGLVEQFRLLLSSQVAVEMKAREANIRVAEQKSKLVEQDIKRVETEFVRQNGNTKQRCQIKMERICKEHESFLHDLDGHVFEITDNIYPAQVESKFSYISQPFWGSVASHAAESAAARSEVLMTGYREALKALFAFMAQRQQSYKELASLTLPDLAHGTYGLSYWFCVTEDVMTKQRHVEVYFESELSANGSLSGVEINNKLEQIRAFIKDSINLADLKEIKQETLEPVLQMLRKNYQTPEEEIERLKRDRILVHWPPEREVF